MKITTLSASFAVGSMPFLSELTAFLSRRIGLHLSSVSTPQSLVCYQVDKKDATLRLRFVLIPFSNGQLLGRLSWLDWRGVDHVCCYVNEAFDCLAMTPGGVWKRQSKRAEALCLERYYSLMA